MSIWQETTGASADRDGLDFRQRRLPEIKPIPVFPLLRSDGRLLLKGPAAAPCGHGASGGLVANLAAAARAFCVIRSPTGPGENWDILKSLWAGWPKGRHSKHTNH